MKRIIITAICFSLPIIVLSQRKVEDFNTNDTFDYIKEKYEVQSKIWMGATFDSLILSLPYKIVEYEIGNNGKYDALNIYFSKNPLIENKPLPKKYDYYQYGLSITFNGSQEREKYLQQILQKGNWSKQILKLFKDRKIIMLLGNKKRYLTLQYDY